ncbi:acyl-protein synthetase [Candidatus Thioglobus sp.]|nr:acyl-protein synthetase [Candidatus Thioglobus sp.]
MNDLFEIAPYKLDANAKKVFLLSRLNELTVSHLRDCDIYKQLGSNLDFTSRAQSLCEVPFIPVQIFKSHKLVSKSSDLIIKTLTSSGTTGDAVSRVFLDKETANLQTKALASIMKDYLGKKRLPMIILDTKSVFKNRAEFSARGAGILGMANFGRDHIYALNENMSLDYKSLEEWLCKYRGKQKLIFGFTFMVWKHLYEYCKMNKVKLDLEGCTLIHSGGWKKLIEQQVSNGKFKSSLEKQFGIKRVHNFYGMVEQIGSIYMECEAGRLHTSNYGEIIIRNYRNWQPLENGKIGVIQVLSALPQSYPGHSILTEDLGTITGVDDCPCGRMGTTFIVNGRIPKADMRGCSDTYAADSAS